MKSITILLSENINKLFLIKFVKKNRIELEERNHHFYSS